MNCTFKLIRQVPEGYRYRCIHCRLKLTSDHADPKIIHCKCEFQGGVGTELKNLLSFLEKKGDCNSCLSRAQMMDQMGITWCEANREDILSGLKEGAESHGLPYIRLAAISALNLAIYRAKKKYNAWQASLPDLDLDEDHPLPDPLTI